ncbi:telomerase RNA component interacting RNase [Procambarus clarkii]|uniref:telomerase RNA component interacting RNase n=1 Tax=Procambarus clarkii TaxID=6728 RepID=UPI001E671460|nr:telomerase RNA component interacting RNase-like [Procambarus clarkii]
MADGHHHYSSSDSREDDSNSQDATKHQSPNIFRNDGSFMEMFKKLQEDQKKKEEESKCGSGSGATTTTTTATTTTTTTTTTTSSDEDRGTTTVHSSGKEQQKKTSLSFVGKRRGGRILATGMVKKQRKEPETVKPQPDDGKTDAWSQYMSEVRKYKEQSCEEEGKRRPLVK